MRVLAHTAPNYSFKGNSHRTDVCPLNSGVRPMKLRPYFFTIIGVFVAYIHYALFEALVLSDIGCQFSSTPCSDAAFRGTLINVLGFPLWHLPTAIFASLPGVSTQNAEPLIVQAALNAGVWGATTFFILLVSFPRRTAKRLRITDS